METKPDKLDKDNAWSVKDMEEMKKNIQKLEDQNKAIKEKLEAQNKAITEKLDILIKAFPKSAVTKKPLLKD